MFRNILKSHKKENYKMKDEYFANNLVVANLGYISSTDYGVGTPLCFTTKQKYIFNIIEEDGQKKYQEIFTGYITDNGEEIHFFNVPYVENIEPYISYFKNEQDKNIPKHALLLKLDEINFNTQNLEVSNLKQLCLKKRYKLKQVIQKND